ncbi:aminoglycoside phosphotransferase [Streptomyces malaysiensis subsp. malaysiensis]|uniref:aminoglycoside phosphotransferase n=1 Tax=Streptomyces malaysiensis TaxID=92644 RepID=UPI0024C0D95F|nr:aminoglycoside phosphotransferase [Streptomyces sp. NA07423]WHX20896.1 aminoglycoside phosphotransferase [Streptomyces sp. NA07423]
MTAVPGPDEVAEADRRFRLWMRRNLEHAAAHFQLRITGEPVFGWRDRSISAPANSPNGPRWLRVVSEQPQWAHGRGWTGIADANTLSGVPKPCVLGVHEWQEGDWRRQRAEVMTLMPGARCSPTDTAPPGLDPPDGWWQDLQQALQHLASIPTERISTDQAKVDHRVHAAFGADIGCRIQRWETVHGDLHWANLLNPLAILDWELWGRGPAGTDAATLYCYSLTAPGLGQKIRAHFPVLDTPDGHRAQLYVTARLLHRITLGDHPQLTEPLKEHARNLLRALP